MSKITAEQFSKLFNGSSIDKIEENEDYEIYSKLVEYSGDNPKKDFNLFKDNISLIADNLQKIIETEELYYCNVPHTGIDASFMGGRVLTLGDFATLWQAGKFQYSTDACASVAYIFYAAGSILSGSGSASAICLDSGETISRSVNIGQFFHLYDEFIKPIPRNFVMIKRYKYKQHGLKGLSERKPEDEILGEKFNHLNIEEVIEQLIVIH